MQTLNGTSGHHKRTDEAGLVEFFRDIREQHSIDTITFLCIGTDRSTGDALGPLVGSHLLEYGIPHVVGSLSSPCDAHNLEARLAEIPTHHIVVAVDACLGQSATVGLFLVSNEPIRPAQSVGTFLPAVGHYSVAAVVNANGPRPYWTLQVTSLYQVMCMAEQISLSIAKGFGIWKS
ncbi:sporulation protein [Paenibacillus crassostreae]|uniref:Sporulation protein n=1 Tax=Paenibacillus crassostreae TaxID=1763538 RepID=A0A167EWQ7_9BACL|nr:spore protease YyaC [Paenibacillus crassostreae]OAB75952.1 sporulation protein [Paenibacillus crassostreae]